MKREARFEDEMEFGRIGVVLRDRSVCRVEQSFFGWFSQSVTIFLK